MQGSMSTESAPPFDAARCSGSDQRLVIGGGSQSPFRIGAFGE
jgi:hypothetical protein